MWSRILAGASMILFLVAGAIVLKTEPPGPGKDDLKGTEKQALKIAKNVVMYEKRTDTDKTFVIRARTVTQETENLFVMDAFRMDRSDGMKVAGDKARYDLGANRMNVDGPVTVNTPDGWNAELKDVVWDRKEKRAATERPVTVKGDKGILTADRAEFLDDFNKMQLSGNVHAKVARNLLDE